MRDTKTKPKLLGLKCLKCPYYLGQIQCIVSPCRECVLTGRKTNPFDFQRRIMIRCGKRNKREE